LRVFTHPLEFSAAREFQKAVKARRLEKNDNTIFGN
jgi:hypothetical protein